MAGKLSGEIKQSKPFVSKETEAFLNLVRTAESLSREVANLLGAHWLTATQYNVLRILRGAGDDGLSSCEIAARMISAEPDVPRLLARMENLGYIRRTRDSQDRRYVTTRITPRALKLLENLDEPVNDLHRRQFSALPAAQLGELIEMLEELRKGEE